MTRSRWAAVSVLVAVLGAVMAPATAAAPSGRGRPDSVPSARVGAASRSALPLVNGSLDYLNAGLPSEMDPTSPGLFVEDFDDGPITVGNGEPDAQWVHDDVRLRAMAIEGLHGNGQIAVLLAADLYMIFRPDADEIRAKASSPPAAWRGQASRGPRHVHPQPPRPRHGVRRQPRVVRPHDRHGRRGGGRGRDEPEAGDDPGRHR